MNTQLPKETNIKEWTNMPPISEELYNELVKEFNNERNKPMSKETEIFTDLMLIIEDNSLELDLIIHTLISLLNDKQLDEVEDLIVNQYGD